MNCKKISELASKSLDEELGFGKRIEFRMHMMMCGLCSKFRKSMVRINHEAKSHAKQVEDGTALLDVKLPEKARERIRKVIKGE
ncbi:MAG: zf-HC2 domain-containing protein [Mariniblastus sp.]